MRTLRVGGRFVRGLWFSPEGTLLVAGGTEDSLAAVYACDPAGGLVEFLLHLRGARRWAVSADRRLLATAGRHVVNANGVETFEVRCYELGPWAAPIVLVAEGEGAADAARGLAFSPDGQSVAGLMFGPNPSRTRRWAGVYFWSSQTGQLRRDWPSPVTWDGLAFAPAGNWFVTWGEGRLHVWSLPDGNRLAAADVPGHTFAGLSVSPDGRWLAEPHGSGVTLWRVPELQPYATLLGHTGRVTAAEFGPDGRSLLTAGADESVRLWDVETGGQRQALSWDVGPVGSVAFAPDGLTAAAGGQAGQVVVWDLA